MKRALVLGGGGIIGVGWETGLVRGLNEAGFDPRSFDLFLGTSAGSIVGSQLANGRLPPAPGSADAQAAQKRMSEAKLDLAIVAKVFGTWGGMQLTTAQEAASIGADARRVRPEEAERWVELTADRFPTHSWPSKPLWIASVDTETGKRKIWSKDDGVELVRAVAASSAVPGLVPSVRIADRFYMDGQVHSSTNADVLVEHDVDEVVIGMPTSSVTEAGIGPHAERMVRVEIEALEDAGKKVRFRTPAPDEQARLGQNLMDASRMLEAYEVGLEAGRNLAKELA
jgi:NTE family protein